jgi:hypothetical protein
VLVELSKMEQRYQAVLAVQVDYQLLPQRACDRWQPDRPRPRVRRLVSVALAGLRSAKEPQ